MITHPLAPYVHGTAGQLSALAHIETVEALFAKVQKDRRRYSNDSPTDPDALYKRHVLHSTIAAWVWHRRPPLPNGENRVGGQPHPQNEAPQNEAPENESHQNENSLARSSSERNSSERGSLELCLSERGSLEPSSWRAHRNPSQPNIIWEVTQLNLRRRVCVQPRA